MAQGCPSNADYVFGPRVDPSCRSLDFTLLFEQGIFTIGPAALLLLLLPFRLRSLRKRPKLARNGLLHQVKLLSILAYAVANLVLLVFIERGDVIMTPVIIVAASLEFFVAICVLPLSHLEHSRSLRPSGLLSIFLFSTIFLNIVQIRTYWLVPRLRNEFVICYSVAVVTKLLVLILESWDKTSLLSVAHQATSPEERAGVLNRSIFAWLNGLFIRGYMKIISFDDLYHIDRALNSHALSELMQTSWSTTNCGRKYDLAISLFSCLKRPLLAPVLPRIVLVALTFAQPLLIEKVTSYLQQTNSAINRAEGYALIGAYGLVYAGLAISGGWYWHYQYRFITMARGCLVTTIYRKTLSAKLTSVAGSQATTLMSADIERIASGLRSIHEIWANAVEVGIGLWLLYLQIGVASLSAAVIAGLCAIAASFVANIAASRQKVWLAGMQERLHETTNFLKSMKSIKMLGLESKLHDIIMGFRATELGYAMYWRITSCLALALGFTPQLLGPPIIFGIFILANGRGDRVLDTSRLFGSLTIISLLTTPLNSLFQTLPSVMAAFNCLNRIQAYLRVEDVKDPRHFVDAGTARFAFSIRNGTFAWKSGSAASIRDINCSIPKGKLTMLIGPVGCGKSTLLQALLGEVVQTRGEVQCSSSDIAFCSQQAWLTNTTVRLSIVGTSMPEDDWYQTVLHACDLTEDIRNMPAGDNTLIGSAGNSLSGGQKQRLTLARAVYVRKPVLLLDDVLSGLDRSTEHRILENLFGSNGLLINANITVVLVTTAERNLRLADHIIELGTAGQGSTEYTQRQKVCSEEIATYADMTNHRNQSPALQDLSSFDTGGLRTRSIRVESDVGEVQNSKISDWRVFLHYVKAASPWQIALLAGEMTVFGFLLKFPTYWAQVWSEASENATQPANDSYYWGIFALLYFLAMINVCETVWHLFMHIIPQSGQRLHEQLLTTVLDASHMFLSRMDIGALINRFSQDLLLIDTELPIALINVGTAVTAGLTGLGLIASASGLFLVVVPLLFVVLYIIQKIYLRTSKRLRLLDLQAKAPLYAQFTDALSGLATIRAFGWAARFETENDNLLDMSQRPFYLMYCIQRWLKCVLELVVAGLAVVVMGLVVAYRSEANASAVGVALINLVSLGVTIQSAVTEYTDLETSLGAVARIQDFVASTPQEVDGTGEESGLSISHTNPAAVMLEQVTATYGLDGDRVLDGVSIRVQAGEKIAICGRSGSGKSSFLNVLLRLLEPSSGSLSIRGKSSVSASARVHRSQLNAIPQEPYFFPGSYRSNLTRDNQISEDRIWEVLRKVNLETKVRSLGGLDETLLSETLSAGELQLLSLARAVLHTNGILLLDEATSNVDNETDVKMHDIIWEEFKSETIIAVLHKQEALHRFDRVIVLDRGKVAFQGTPSELMVNNGVR